MRCLLLQRLLRAFQNVLHATKQKPGAVAGSGADGGAAWFSNTRKEGYLAQWPGLVRMVARASKVQRAIKTVARFFFWSGCKTIFGIHAFLVGSAWRSAPTVSSGLACHQRPAGMARFRQGSRQVLHGVGTVCQGAKAPIQHRRHQKHGDLKIVQTLRTKPAH